MARNIILNNYPSHPRNNGCLSISMRYIDLLLTFAVGKLPSELCMWSIQDSKVHSWTHSFVSSPLK
jgi:hypothetical protein